MQCSVFIATSVDGFVAGVGDDLGWLRVVERPGEDYGYEAFMGTVDVLVMGRRTYEVALGFPSWPYAGKRVVVMSRALGAGDVRHGVEVFGGSPGELVASLRAQGLERAYVDGAALIRSFLEAGLIDDLTLSVVPVVLGGGIRLFGDAGSRRDLVLEESRAFPSGLVRSRYRLARP
ncbi:MAG: dihydrofolate reductase [Deltaproteobacteria bacterium]|nr:dihydrofolate reductase [Deltaproteobacteria bacterium]